MSEAEGNNYGEGKRGGISLGIVDWKMYAVVQLRDRGKEVRSGRDDLRIKFSF